MDRKSKGKYGEEMACTFLEKGGMEIIERNYRHGRGEIDLIGLIDNKLLVFVEVKIRKDNRFGDPETFVSENQQNLILNTAEHYMDAIHWEGDIRFDVVAINESLGEILHIEDAFY